MSLLLLFTPAAAAAGTGSANITLGALTLSSAGTVDVQGQAALTLGALTTTAAGTVDVFGAASITLGTLTTAAAGTVDVRGSAAVTLASLTLSSAGAVAISGAASVTLASLTCVATATATSANDGAASITLGALTVSGRGALDLPSTTTAAAIREFVADSVAGLVAFPSFRRHRDGEDFRRWAEANPAAALRRFQVRIMRTDEAPDVSNTSHETGIADLELVIAYPVSARHGRDNALDRDDAAKADHDAIETAIGRRAWSGFIGTDHDAEWLSGEYKRERGRSVDFLVITQRMRYRRAR